VPLIKAPGLCADFPDRREPRNRVNRQSISSSQKDLEENHVVKKSPLTKGELEEMRAMEAALQDSVDTLLNYKLGQIDLNKDEDETNQYNSSLKIEEPNRDLKCVPMEIVTKNYNHLTPEEKDVVKQLCKYRTKDLKNKYTKQLAKRIKEKKKQIKSERMSIELAGLTGVIQVEPEEAECIQKNTLYDEEDLKLLKEEYRKLKESFWHDEKMLKCIKFIVRDALLTFDVVNDEDIEKLCKRYCRERGKKRN
jgi:hypothetical protein